MISERNQRIRYFIWSCQTRSACSFSKRGLLSCCGQELNLGLSFFLSFSMGLYLYPPGCSHSHINTCIYIQYVETRLSRCYSEWGLFWFQTFQRCFGFMEWQKYITPVSRNSAQRKHPDPRWLLKNIFTPYIRTRKSPSNIYCFGSYAQWTQRHFNSSLCQHRCLCAS